MGLTLGLALGLDPRTDPWTDPRTDPRTDSRTDPWTEPRTDPRTDPRIGPRIGPRAQICLGCSDRVWLQIQNYFMARVYFYVEKINDIKNYLFFEIRYVYLLGFMF